MVKVLIKYPLQGNKFGSFVKNLAGGGGGGVRVGGSAIDG